MAASAALRSNTGLINEQDSGLPVIWLIRWLKYGKWPEGLDDYPYKLAAGFYHCLRVLDEVQEEDDQDA